MREHLKGLPTIMSKDDCRHMAHGSGFREDGVSGRVHGLGADLEELPTMTREEAMVVPAT